MSLATLGTFSFNINQTSFESLKRSATFRHPQQQVINTHPVSQFVGVGEQNIMLAGTLYPEHTGRLHDVSTLREMAKTGKPQPLHITYLTSSEVLGFWVITGIDEEQTYFHQNGQPRKITFSIELQYYGDQA